MMGRLSKIVAVCLIVIAGVGGASEAMAQDAVSEIDCSQYLWQEDAELGEEQQDVCTDLPPISDAPTCSDFSSQGEAQELFDTNPYGYRMLTAYGSGTGEDSTIACPELTTESPSDGTDQGNEDVPAADDANEDAPSDESLVTALPKTGSGDTSMTTLAPLGAAGVTALLGAAIVTRRFASMNR